MLLEDTDVYVDAQGYPLFTMSSLLATPWRGGDRLQTSCGGILCPFAWIDLVEPDGIEPTT